LIQVPKEATSRHWTLSYGEVFEPEFEVNPTERSDLGIEDD
jgi:hypothetical protein